MDLEEALNLRGAGSLCHLRQGFDQLLFGMQNVAKLVHEEFLDGSQLSDNGISRVHEWSKLHLQRERIRCRRSRCCIVENAPNLLSSRPA
jgi:hypothetical protein